MLKFLRSLIPSSNGSGSKASPSLPVDPPFEVQAFGAHAFPLERHLSLVDGLPYLDWQAVSQWVGSMGDPQVQAKAWAECEVAWLLHLKVALGSAFTLSQQGESLLLSSLEPNVARMTLEYMCKTLRRIQRVLDGVAQVPEWGKDILIVFEDDETYYRYVSHFYPEGEFAASGGMYIGNGCGHFATMKADLHVIEPVIAHEMTHGCLSHLPIPLWLNEGLAVNTERRVSRVPAPLYTPVEMQRKHLRYWDESKIQEFWSGKSFLSTDDGNLLSYDLAQKIVEQFASNWDVFRAFVLSASAEDSGASAAMEHFELDLGEVAKALVGRETSAAWGPTPTAWSTDCATHEPSETSANPSADRKAQQLGCRLRQTFGTLETS